MDDDPPDTPEADTLDAGAPDAGTPAAGGLGGTLPPGGAPPQQDTPPADTPPADTPPADTPPADTPPADSGPVVTNSVSASPQNPVVRPRVRNIRQYDGPWGSQSVRRDTQRNITGTVTKYDSWEGNGCFPTVIAIVLNWLQTYHGPTKGQLVFPKSQPGSGDFTPVQLCQIMGPDDYADCTGVAWKDEDAKKYGYNNPEHKEYTVSAGNITGGVVKTTAPAGSGNQVALARTRLRLSGSADDKSAVIKQYLHYGPVMVNMTHPGHWVVIDAFVDTKIYICDPGMVMESGGRYYSTGGTYVSADEMPSGVKSTQGYYTIDATGTVTSKNKKYSGKWLDSLLNLDVIYVPDPSDSSSPPKPFYPHQDFDTPGPMNADSVAAPTGASETAPAAAPDTGTPAAGATEAGTPAAGTPAAGSDGAAGETDDEP